MKISQEHQKQGKLLHDKLIAKAWESASFKEQLINNPEDTIKNLADEKIVFPEANKLIVEDQTHIDTIYLNIPKKLNLNDFELTDEQLEVVSGGIVAATAGVTLAVVGLFAAGVAIGMAMQD
jgi:hypothetical protein